MKTLSIKLVPLVGALLTIALFSEAKEPRFPDIITALRAADSEKNLQKKGDLFRELEAYPIRNCDDAKHLYSWLEEYPSRTFPNGGVQPASMIAQSVAKALSHATAPACHELIADWLAKEVRSLPPDILRTALRQFQPSERQMIKEGLQYQRIHALIHAAGDGKNEMALPILRKMLKMGLYDYTADYAVGRIGKEEDLEWFVTELEKGDSSLRMRLQEFGPLAIRRIMREIENPKIPREKAMGLRHWIAGVAGRENIPLLVPLLQNRDPFIERVAAMAIEKNATSEDELLLLSMLDHSNSEVRRSAVNALARENVWRFRYINPILRILQSDKAARFAATQAVGRLGICESIPVLQEVIRTVTPNESWPSSHALEDINRAWTAFPTSPSGRKRDEYNQSLMDSWADPSSPDKDRYWAAQNWAHEGFREKAIALYRDVLVKGSDDTSRYKSLRDLWRMQDEPARKILQEAAQLPDIGSSVQYALNHWPEGCHGEVPPEGKRQ